MEGKLNQSKNLSDSDVQIEIIKKKLNMGEAKYNKVWTLLKDQKTLNFL